MFDLLYKLFDFFINSPWKAFTDLIEWVQEFVTRDIPNALWHLMPTGLAEYLSTIDLQSLASVVQPVTWFIPIWGILLIYSTGYSLAAGVRVVRFIIGFIPTIEG